MYYGTERSHCLSCIDYHCLRNISKNLKKAQNEKDKNFKDIKNRLISSYINNLNCEDRIKRNNHDFIDSLNITEDLKKVLKLYSNEI